jgi:hypothetical protein
MLAYLEELCTALLAHDAIAIHRLLTNPLARSLPRQVREEAIAISRASPTSLRAPIQALRFYHQTLQLGESDTSPDRAAGESGESDADSHMASHVAAARGDGARSPTEGAQDIVRDAQRDQIELPLASLGGCAAA